MTDEQIRRVEAMVNAEILRNEATSARIMKFDDAVKGGAMALFGEKYGDEVRVLDIGSSRELCGGTHVSRTGDIGLFKITAEGGVAAGIRRVEAVTGEGALALIQSLNRRVNEAAAALKAHDQALLIGQPSAGRAVEYSDFPLTSGKVLRVAIGEVIGPNGVSLFPDGVKPDVPVELPLAQKHQIFAQSAQRGLTAFVFENERPHFNEAALIAGTNPEIEIRQQRRGPEESAHDSVLQRAVDVITSLAIFQKH